jgi:hypothetical protein
MGLSLVAVNADQTVQDNFNEIARQWPDTLFRGSGDPNGAVTGGPGAVYVDVATGRRWFHEAPTTDNTNWVLK